MRGAKKKKSRCVDIPINMPLRPHSSSAFPLKTRASPECVAQAFFFKKGFDRLSGFREESHTIYNFPCDDTRSRSISRFGLKRTATVELRDVDRCINRGLNDGALRTSVALRRGGSTTCRQLTGLLCYT